MVISAAVLLVLFIGLFLSRGYEAPFLNKEKKKLKIPIPLAAFGLYVRDHLRVFRKQKRIENNMAAALMMSMDTQKIAAAGRIGLMWLFLVVGAAISFIYAYANRGHPAVDEIARPVFGEEKLVTLEVEGLESVREIDVSVSGRDPEETAMYKVFDMTFEEMKAVWLNENADFDHIVTDMDLPKKTDSGIRISYKSLSPEVISDYGYILKDAVPEAGAEGAIDITFSYNGYEKTYGLPFSILPEDSLLTEKDRLELLLKTADEESPGEKVMRLPAELNGYPIAFRERQISPLILLAMFAALTCLVYIVPNEELKSAYKKRNERLAEAFPGILSKLSILIRAGMSIRMAWEKIVRDYQALQKNGAQVEFAYEEMLQSYRELLSGSSEEEVYIRFGKRCELHNYVKLGNLLSQNLKQGTKGLADMLDSEMSAAFEEKKNKALKKGEEAGTKLLFPMMLMLAIVIVVLIVPAFMSF